MSNRELSGQNDDFRAFTADGIENAGELTVFAAAERMAEIAGTNYDEVEGELLDFANMIDGICESGQYRISTNSEYNYPIASQEKGMVYYNVRLTTQDHISENNMFDSISLMIHSSELDQERSFDVFKVRFNHTGEVDHQVTTEEAFNFIDPDDFNLDQAVDHMPIYWLISDAKRLSGKIDDSLSEEHIITELVRNYNDLTTRTNPVKIKEVDMVTTDSGVIKIVSTYDSINMTTTRHISLSADEDPKFECLLSYRQITGLTSDGLETKIDLSTSSLKNESYEGSLSIIRVARGAVIDSLIKSSHRQSS